VNEYATGLWKLIAYRMTQSDGGWKLLREFEAFVESQI